MHLSLSLSLSLSKPVFLALNSLEIRVFGIKFTGD
jgi:hypothetical protein